MSLYQTENWKKVMQDSGYRLLELEGMNAFEAKIESFLGEKKIIFARGTPSEQALKEFAEKSKEYSYGTITPQITNYDDVLFKKLGFKRTDDFTIMVSLEKSKDELFKQLEKKSSRWGVKTAEKNSLIFAEVRESELKEIFKLYKDTADKGGYKSEPFEFFSSCYKNIVKENQGKFFVVKQKPNKILAGALLLIDLDHTMLHLTGASDLAYRLQAMPFLYWNLILYSKSLNKKYFDLGGYDAEAKEGEKTYAINRFKTNFGGDIWPQPIYSTGSFYTLTRKLLRKFRFIKKIYSKSK
ncbi:MAG: peptidoglycan bridge formation glycyltransferase FemA/FemB family protein [Candidatus Pacearchaeota archaeon]|nr:peptidoglycan bridge formation glycyltransferase FemA/FemB family protein [Candidatus Pacearchaeota archaeon]